MARQIVVSLIADSSKFSGQFGKGMDQAESKLSKFNAKAKVVSAAVLGGLAAIGKESVNLAATQSANFSKYEQVTKKAMDSTSKAQARSLNLSQSSYADYYSQLSAMYQSNGIGTEKANKMAAESMKTAADAAAFGNTTVGEAVEAQLGLLKGSGELWEKYSVSIKASDISARMKADGLDKLTGKEKKAAEAATRHKLAQEASALFLGQAAKESGSLESRQQRLKATMDDLGASLGSVLLPIVVAVTEKFQQFALWAENNQTTVKVLAGVIGGLAAAVWVINGAVKAYTAVQAACNAVMALNPAILITVAVIALVAAIYLIATKTTWFQQIWSKAWGAIKSVTSSTFNFLKGLFLNWTGPGLIIKHFDKIRAGAKAMGDGIKSVFNGVKSAISGVVNAIKSAWNNTVGGKGIHIPSVGIGPFKTPGVDFSIPYLAHGGKATGGMPHIVGEQGPEMFIPNQSGSVVSNRQLLGAMGAGGGGTTNVYITVQGSVVTERELVDAVQRGLIQKTAYGFQKGL